MTDKYRLFGKTGLSVPRITHGTSTLGNLYQAIPYESKKAIIEEWFANDDPVVVDSAGKYGAGLALEVMGKAFNELNIPKEKVVISNKLAWVRVPLEAPEPTFEPGAWMGLEHDAKQKISYEGILECHEQGCDLLKSYDPQLLSVHDPEEYIAAANDEENRNQRRQDIKDAYRALTELKTKGKSAGTGVGCKDWQVIRDLYREIDLDWVMFANSFTIMHHPPELLNFLDELQAANVGVINSAIFHGGFLMGSEFFNYYKVTPENRPELFEYRLRLYDLCKKWDLPAAAVCAQFASSHPAIHSLAMSTSNADRIKKNNQLLEYDIPKKFWVEMKDAALIDSYYEYLD